MISFEDSIMKKFVFTLCGVLWFFLSFSQPVDFTSSNLPIIVINTQGSEIPDDYKITADMGVIYNGDGVINNLSDPYTDYNGKIGIELRGSSSQFFPKKPYGIELRNDAGVGISVGLLGMPAEEDWVLNATYNDRSLMRDALAYKLGRDLGRYAPRTRYCELVINGEYQGIYLLVEKIKRDKNRVDISKLDPTEISGDDLTGGYIIKIDKTTGNSGTGFDSEVLPAPRSCSQIITFQYEYPAFDEIANEQRQYIKTYVRNFETVLKSAAYTDAVHGYRKYMDVNSCVDFLIMNEITRNVDGYRLSTFFYKDKDSNGGKLTMGPLWDYNLAFGNADYCQGWVSQGWAYDFNNYCPEDGILIPFWWSRFLSDANFNNLLAARWKDLRQNKLSTDALHTYIDSVAAVMNKGAQQRNFQRWPIFNIYVWPNYDWKSQSSYSLSVAWLKTWISQRMTWLDNAMPKVITTSVEPDRVEIKLKVYPIPSANDGVIEYETTNPGAVQLEIYDVTGATVISIHHANEAPGVHQIKINKLDLPPGVYFCSVVKGKVKLTEKIIKQ
jgi:hypothetical protein